MFEYLNESKYGTYIYTHSGTEYQSLATVHVEIKQRNESSKRWNVHVNSVYINIAALTDTHHTDGNQNKYSIVHMVCADVRAAKWVSARACAFLCQPCTAIIIQTAATTTTKYNTICVQWTVHGVAGYHEIRYTVSIKCKFKPMQSTFANFGNSTHARTAIVLYINAFNWVLHGLALYCCMYAYA